MFTRQHYKAIAETLKANRPREPKRDVQFIATETQLARCSHHRCIVDQLANLFAQDNPQFDWDKFIDATGG